MSRFLIKLRYQRQRKAYNNQTVLEYSSGQGGYRLTVPRKPDFDNLPDELEITIWDHRDDKGRWANADDGPKESGE